MSNLHQRVHVIVHRASHNPGVIVPFLEIQAVTPIDDPPDTVVNLTIVARMETDAQRLYDALTATLPQGTIDRLFVRLAKRAASMIVIARPDTH